MDQENVCSGSAPGDLLLLLLCNQTSCPESALVLRRDSGPSSGIQAGYSLRSGSCEPDNWEGTQARAQRKIFSRRVIESSSKRWAGCRAAAKIAAILARTVPLARATRLTSPATAGGGPAPGGTCVCRHWRAAIALARRDRSEARAVSRARCNLD